jgi:hypothetical protein
MAKTAQVKPNDWGLGSQCLSTSAPWAGQWTVLCRAFPRALQAFSLPSCTYYEHMSSCRQGSSRQYHLWLRTTRCCGIIIPILVFKTLSKNWATFIWTKCSPFLQILNLSYNLLIPLSVKWNSPVSKGARYTYELMYRNEDKAPLKGMG